MAAELVHGKQRVAARVNDGLVVQDSLDWRRHEKSLAACRVRLLHSLYQLSLSLTDVLESPRKATRSKAAEQQLPGGPIDRTEDWRQWKAILRQAQVRVIMGNCN
jgi:hypothetical protein